MPSPAEAQSIEPTVAARNNPIVSPLIICPSSCYLLCCAPERAARPTQASPRRFARARLIGPRFG